MVSLGAEAAGVATTEGALEPRGRTAVVTAGLFHADHPLFRPTPAGSRLAVIASRSLFRIDGTDHVGVTSASRFRVPVYGGPGRPDMILGFSGAYVDDIDGFAYRAPIPTRSYKSPKSSKMTPTAGLQAVGRPAPGWERRGRQGLKQGVKQGRRARGGGGEECG
jgi:hypothetical protein